MIEMEAIFVASDPWYVVHCKSAKEQYVANILRHHLGLTTYLPEVALYWRKEIQHVPFFSGYVFLQANLQKLGTNSINSCPGVLRLLDFGDGPVEVPQILIETIQEEIARRNRRICSQKFSPGDPVRVTTGPLQGLWATFLEAKTSGERASILLHMLGRLNKVQLDVHTLEKIDAQEDLRPITLRRKRGTRGKGRKIFHRTASLNKRD